MKMDNCIYIVYLINNEVGSTKSKKHPKTERINRLKNKELEKHEKPDEEQEAKK